MQKMEQKNEINKTKAAQFDQNINIAIMLLQTAMSFNIF